MKLVSWNVNSIRMRLERLLGFLQRSEPDVVCLQEIKVTGDAFPREEILAAGYHTVLSGQKTYNGVAILSREPFEGETFHGLEDGVDDLQARFLSARTCGVRVVCCYVPNGQEVGSDKWSYKLQWLQRLRGHLDARCAQAEPVAVCGDFNVATDDRDVHDPAGWADTVLYCPEAREALAGVTGWGLEDTLRLHRQEGGLYSWWDYRQGAFHRGWGLRIDYVFASAPLAGRCTDAYIDRDERKGKQPSDHAPVVALFEPWP